MKRLITPTLLLGAAFAYIMLMISLTGAKPESNPLPGICIYSVAVNQLINEVSIAWTSQPCQDLDVAIAQDFYMMQHSQFRAACPVWSVQTWPDKYLPIVDYHASCNLTLDDLQKKAVIDHAIIGKPND